MPKALHLTDNFTLLKQFKSIKHYRYKYLESNPVKNENLLVCLHGYGQLVEYFSKKFKSIEKSHSLLFPEGMHRFYLSGTSGRVGASWMTKEDRLMDIYDNMHWLAHLIQEIVNQKKYQQITLLGFSQGGATAYRLYQHMPKNYFNKLIVWGNDFPNDLEEKNIYSSCLYVLGNKDQFIQGSRAEEISNQYQTNGFEIINYDGNHDIDANTLMKIMA